MMQATRTSGRPCALGRPEQRLLDDGENNVGNATILNPQKLPARFEFTVQRNPPHLASST